MPIKIPNDLPASKILKEENNLKDLTKMIV